MPSAASRAAHCLSTGRHAGHRPAAARGIAYCLLAVALLAPAGAVAADGCLQQIAVQPGRSVDVAVSASRLLIEEVGTDIEYRWNAGEDFTAVATPPDRLGFDVLAARSHTLTLRIREGQGGGQIRIDSCLDDADATFFSGLAALQTRSLEAGRDAARAALPALTYLRRWPLAARHAGWVSSAHANVLASAGENNAAETAFLDSSRDWQQAGRPDRAAIALMAAGDNASRANRFDVAREWLTQARDELERLGVTYYALRSEGALCTVLAREGRYREAIACEEQVIARWNVQQEKRETAVREISAGNLWQSLGDLDQAQKHYTNAKSLETALAPLVRARLNISVGANQLARGDLPSASRLFSTAAQQLGSKGLPVEQINLDIKLANLAQLAGAIPEQIRLLDSALIRLQPGQDPLRVALINIQLSRAKLSSGLHGEALTAAEQASESCEKLGNEVCRQEALLGVTRALLEMGKTQSARATLLAMNPVDENVRIEKTMLLARADLLDGDTKTVPASLQALDEQSLDLVAKAQLSRLRAAVLLANGDRAGALRQLQDALNDHSERISGWPSAALRISALARLAELQAAFFDTLLDGAGRELSTDDFRSLIEAIQAASVSNLFARRADADIPDTLRKVLSTSINEGAIQAQRELLVALATSPVTTERPQRRPDNLGIGTLDADDAVLLPLAGERTFHLVVWHTGKARICLQIPLQSYRELTREFDEILDGERTSASNAQRSAADWHADIDRCNLTGRVATRWHVVATEGTPRLPWSWIAAAGTGPEPSVSITHEFPVRSPLLGKTTRLTLLDLDMPRVSPLPMVSTEADAIQSSMSGFGVAARRLKAADLPLGTVLQELSSAPLVHVIGHANPAAFGQLYQGLWYETDGKPALLTYPEIAANPTDAELVVLSACGTRHSDQQRYGTTSNLADALIAAGARRVVAASNPLSDAAAPLWSKVFYETLWRTGDAATAARDARTALRESPHFRHPKFWAGIEFYAAAGSKTAADAATSSMSTKGKQP